jgi:hypothetical protein
VRSFVVLLVCVAMAAACESNGTRCEATFCAPTCRPIYYGEDRSGCGVCQCGGQICPPLTCDPVGLDAGLAINDTGCAQCAPD